jgi:hypothetical protein
MILFIDEPDEMALEENEDMNRLDAPFSLELNDIID